MKAKSLILCAILIILSNSYSKFGHINAIFIDFEHLQVWDLSKMTYSQGNNYLSVSGGTFYWNVGGRLNDPFDKL